MRAAIVFTVALALGTGAGLAQSGPTPVAPTATKPGQPALARPPASKDSPADGIAECMRLWDAATHMTRQEWSRTCRRIQTRLENLKLDNLKIENLKFDQTMPKAARKKRQGG